jgi:cell division transport system permease protein
MSAPSGLAYFARTVLVGMARAPFVHVIAVSSLALALSGYGLARVATSHLDALVASLGGEVELTVYLAADASPEQVQRLERALIERTGGATRRVSPAEALGRLAEGLGEHGRALTALGENPLPWSLELSLPEAARDPASLRALAESAQQLPFVAGVDYGAEALERLTLIGRGLRAAGAVAFLLVFLTTVVVVSATLQLAIFARRDEIEIQRLVGATDGFVRVPFLLEGLLQGLMGGGAALALVFAAAVFVDSGLADSVAFARVGGGLRVDWVRLGGEQAAIGMALGLLGSFVAVRRFMRV